MKTAAFLTLCGGLAATLICGDGKNDTPSNPGPWVKCVDLHI
jgi:hypothetical protein